jgi:PAS domain S-box-containing protein
VAVLHVDPDASALAELGHPRLDVTTAATVAAGLERLTDTDVDCVVADADLPDGEDLTFLERVRADHEHLPFVLYTAVGSESLAGRAIEAGVDGYFRKAETGVETVVDRVLDAVEEYHTQRELVESRKRLSLFLEQSPLGVIEWNEEFRIERTNDAALDIRGYDEGELVGRRWRAFVPDCDRSPVGEVVGQLLDARGGTHSVNENVTRDDDRITCEWHNRAVTNEAGETVAVFSQFQDVTERHERRRTLEQLHGASRDLLTADTKRDVADVIIAAVRDTLGYDNNAVRLVDDAGEKLHVAAMTDGIDDVLGDRPVYDVGEGTAGRAFSRSETLLYDDVRSIDDDFDRGDARAGMYIPLGSHGILSINDTTVGAFDESDVQLAEVFAANAAVALDRIAQTQRLERQNERLDEFASVVSHDLQNPLNVAMGNVTLAREECDSDHLAAVERAHDRMQTLTTDLLSLAREEDGDADLESVDLASAVRTCWQHVETSDVTLVVDTERTLTASTTRLQQLLENLFRNAVEHAGPDVTVTVGDVDDGFYVADDGPGIPEKYHERVFETGYTTAAGGSGFGLNIVRTIAEAHGWTVRVSDGDGGGTRFEFHGVGPAVD